jgi:serine/threonine protein kinase
MFDGLVKSPSIPHSGRVGVEPFEFTSNGGGGVALLRRVKRRRATFYEVIMFDSLKLSELPEIQCGILRKPSGTRPTIWIVEEKGVRAVVKDFSTSKFLFRNTVGRFLVWRESKAYGKMKNLAGIPNLYRIIDGLALVMEEIPGSNLEEIEDKMEIPQAFFDALKDLVAGFHKRGLAHCDLKRAPNTLLGNDGLPYIIDWGASISAKEFRLFPLNLIYRRFLRDDYMAIIKMKLRHTPEAVTPEERKFYRYRSGPEKVLRGIRDRFRNILQKIA